jgi:hypothetical protein
LADVGLEAVVLAREPLAGAAEAGLHLVEDQQDAVLIGQFPQPMEEASRCRVVTPFALYGFDQEGGYLVRHDLVLELQSQFAQGVLGGFLLAHAPTEGMGEGGDEH